MSQQSDDNVSIVATIALVLATLLIAGFLFGGKPDLTDAIIQCMGAQ